MNEIERLINSTFPFVKDLLIKNGEFYPVASAIKNDDNIAQIGVYDDEEKPLSDKVIADLKSGFKANNADYKTIAIFYDVMVEDPNTNIISDAIAIYVENIIEKSAFIFYYPYSLTSDNLLTFSIAWKELNDKEIFL